MVLTRRIQYRLGGRGTPTRRYTIGRHGTLTPDQARNIASDLAAEVAVGVHPIQTERDAQTAAIEARRQAEERVRQEAGVAFEKVAATWLFEYELDHRPRCYEQAVSAMNKHLIPALRGRPLWSWLEAGAKRRFLDETSAGSGRIARLIG